MNVVPGVSVCLICIIGCAQAGYLVGTGKADITGPVADVNLMGYANPSQFAGGILNRLYARALLVADEKDPKQRWVFINLDACMASQAVTFTVLERLAKRYGQQYTEQNVAMSGTHTHSGPSGYLQYLIYGISSLGFYTPSFDALVDGIVEAIESAHESVGPASLHVAVGEVLGANINRSPTAYLHNPAGERARYRHNIDKEMTVLAARGSGADAAATAQPRAVFSWFPVHGTSVNNTNTLVNGDNKGLAAQLLERRAPGTVAAFCQANVGDTSPNTLGPRCRDTGEPCDAVHSTCNGRVAECIGRGPAWPDNIASCAVIARKQADAAHELMQREGEQVSGAVQSRHAFLDMRGLVVAASPHTRAGVACKPAMGMAFAAGTTDGPGAFDFKQSDTNGTAFWRLVRNFIQKPSAEQMACHAPKPILLDVGDMHFPYDWAPAIVEIGILRAGQFAILAVPGEFTTMSGRRLRAAVRDTVGEAWGKNLTVVIAGLTNTYASYVTTFEEYQAQRYEGGFTLFGPNTLDAYIQEFKSLAKDMVDGAPLNTEDQPRPPNLLSKQWSLVPPVVTDSVPWGSDYGRAVEDVEPGRSFLPGDEVRVVFQSACPRNNIRRGGTFLTVERQAREGAGWEVVATDDDWETRFAWGRHRSLSSESFATITWIIPNGTTPGRYRIGHQGDYKHVFGWTHRFSGYSTEFDVAGEGRGDERQAPSSIFSTLRQWCAKAMAAIF
ncbi:hypothetical protein ACKKBG_A27130 [Auxenochlorella protothecoides x Auxenochlorella symbiontica]